MSAIRSWLRAHRSAVVQEVLRRGRDFDAIAPPPFMFSTRSTSEPWLALEEWAARDLERRRKAKEEAERPIREAAATERTREIADWLEAHALGKRSDFYAPSRSGIGTLENAVLALRGGKP